MIKIAAQIILAYKRINIYKSNISDGSLSNSFDSVLSIYDGFGMDLRSVGFGVESNETNGSKR